MNCLSSGEKIDEPPEVPVNGRTYKVPSKIEESYTKITLDKLTPTARSFFRKTRGSKETRRSTKTWSGSETLEWKQHYILNIVTLY